MRSLTNRSAGLLVVILLLIFAASGQQPGDHKKKVPVMSSEDVDGVHLAKQPTVVSSTEASPAGLTRYALEGCGLSIALPAAPVDSEVELARADRHRLGPVKCHTSVGNGYVVIVCHVQSSGQATLEGQLDEFVEGFFQGISSSPGHSNAKYTIGDKSSNRESFRASSK